MGWMEVVWVSFCIFWYIEATTAACAKSSWSLAHIWLQSIGIGLPSIGPSLGKPESSQALCESVGELAGVISSTEKRWKRWAPAFWDFFLSCAGFSNAERTHGALYSYQAPKRVYEGMPSLEHPKMDEGPHFYANYICCVLHCFAFCHLLPINQGNPRAVAFQVSAPTINAGLWDMASWHLETRLINSSILKMCETHFDLIL